MRNANIDVNVENAQHQRDHCQRRKGHYEQAFISPIYSHYNGFVDRLKIWIDCKLKLAGNNHLKIALVLFPVFVDDLMQKSELVLCQQVHERFEIIIISCKTVETLEQ